MAQRKLASAVEGMQLPMFRPKSVWKPPSIDDLPSWEGAGRIGIDTETKDPYLKELGLSVRRGGYIAGISFAIEDGPCHYLPVQHEGGDNLDKEAVFRYLRDQAKVFKGDLVGTNIGYDLDYLAEQDVTFDPRFFRDVQVAEPLINENHFNYSLKEISKRHGLPGKDQTALEEAAHLYGVDPKGGLWRLPARYVGAYAEQDARLPLQLIRRQERKLDELGLWKVYDMESRVTPVLVKLRRRGVKVNLRKLKRIETWSLSEEAKALKKVYEETKIHIQVGEVWEARTVAPAIEAIGQTVKLTSKTKQPSIDQEFLKSIKHPVAKAILRARKVNKLRQFAASVRKHEVNGRIHCTFNQMVHWGEDGNLGARFGRLSSSNLNMQNQPKRDKKIAARWRKIYEPDDGALWACNDYSQQEPRWTTHFAAKINLAGARDALNKYISDPSMDNHQFMADLTGLDRDYAKEVWLGITYGEGGAKLCRALELPTRWVLQTGRGRERVRQFFESREDALKEAAHHDIKRIWEAAGEKGQDILDKFDKRAPFIRLLASEVQKTARRRGYIITVYGRHLHFPLKDDGSYDWTHIALNRLIQGSAADQTKLAMVELDRELPEFHQQLQVHDELDASVESPEVAVKAAKIMEECIKIPMPFKVGVEIGPSWGDLKKHAA